MQPSPRRPTATSSIRWSRRGRLPRWWRARKARGQDPLTFGMTFPFSTHNYHLRFWMAAGGVDPDEDVRLVVLPPPYMVESLANGHVDGFCVGAPWNSVAVDLGIGVILHFVSEILARASEKLLAVRQPGRRRTRRRLLAPRARPPAGGRLHRGHAQPRRGRRNPGGAQPHRRRGRGDPPHARWPPEGDARRQRAHGRPLPAGRARRRRPPRPACRRRGCTRRWCAGGRPRCRPSCWPLRKAVVRPDLYDAALARPRREPQADRPTASARSRGRPSIPAISQATWRPGSIKRRLGLRRQPCCTAQNCLQCAGGDRQRRPPAVHATRRPTNSRH